MEQSSRIAYRLGASPLWRRVKRGNQTAAEESRRQPDSPRPWGGPLL